MFDLLSEVSIDLNASNSFIVISTASSGPLRSSHDRYDPHLSVTILAMSVTILMKVRYDPLEDPLRSSRHFWSCPLRSSALFFEDVLLVYAEETAVGIDTLS